MSLNQKVKRKLVRHYCVPFGLYKIIFRLFRKTILRLINGIYLYSYGNAITNLKYNLKLKCQTRYLKPFHVLRKYRYIHMQSILIMHYLRLNGVTLCI